MKGFLLGLLFSLGVLAQTNPLQGKLAYVKNGSLMLEQLETRQVKPVENSSGLRWFAFTGSRLVLWRDAGLFVAFPPYQKAIALNVNADPFEGIMSVGEKVFLAYRRPNSSVLSYQTHVLTTGVTQPSAFFPETTNQNGTVLAYRIANRVRVLRGNSAETALEFPSSESFNWGVSIPALTPDGKTILFAHNNGTGFLDSGYSRWSLRSRNLERKQEKTLLTRTARIPDGIFVSPDGTRALISYAQDQKNILEIVNLQTGFARVIHQNFVEGVAGSWSPNGQFVIAENISGNNSEVFIKDPNGQTIRTILGAQFAQWIGVGYTLRQ